MKRDPLAVDVALDLHAALIPLLGVVLTRRGGEFSTLCEIGCGSGRLLRDCIERLPQIVHYVGLHDSRMQAQLNRALYRDFPIRFECISLLDWLATQAAPGSIFLTDADELRSSDPALPGAIWRTWRQSLRPALLAIAIPAPAGAAVGFESPLLTDIRRHARAVRYAIEMTFASRQVCLVVAEF
jgi:hypothetical protein